MSPSPVSHCLQSDQSVHASRIFLDAQIIPAHVRRLTLPRRRTTMQRCILISALLCCGIALQLANAEPTADVVFAPSKTSSGEGDAASQPAVKSQVIEAAPEAQLANGIDDIDGTAGALLHGSSTAISATHAARAAP
jgi:hypothetical protein